ncbi:hypothetical protein [Methylobrevis albus]|uniref:Uncharacterized protein n=1 Tax=Methylobrevis albus TaxID=2793297 RepID=A0A931N035_9HYPH|nr:hypothetical protein [Methylobrevis albus]MBH0238376.1 hypothetical protein [Methylobrevis albus]
MTDGDAGFDARDRLILALAALLRAERETRGALAAALEDGRISRETLLAMISDPVPVVTTEDLAVAEDFVRSRRLAAGRTA